MNTKWLGEFFNRTLSLHWLSDYLWIVALLLVAGQLLLKPWPVIASGLASPAHQPVCPVIADGQSINETINPAGEQDCFLFQGNVGDIVTAFVDNRTTAGSKGMRLTILKPDGSQLDSDYHTCCNFDVELRDKVLTISGSYTIIVEGYTDATGPYTLGFSNLSNDTSLITDGQSINGAIDFPGDEDAFTFTGTASDIVTVFVDNRTTGGSKGMRVTILKPDGSQLTSDYHTCCNFDLELRDQVLPDDGIYTIIVDGYTDATGAYTLGFSNLSDDTSTIADGQSVNGIINLPGDEDAFTFSGTAGELVTVRLDNQTTGGSKGMRVTILKPDGTQLVSDYHTCCNFDVELQDMALPADGLYTIIVDGYTDATGPYTLYFFQPSYETSPIADGQSVDGLIDLPGDQDAFTFAGTAGEFVTVRVDNKTTAGSKGLRLILLNPDGSQLTSDYHTCCNFDVDLNDQVLPVDGVYTVIVDGYTDATGPYTLEIETGWYVGRHTAAPLASATEGPIRLKVSDDFSHVSGIRGDPTCLWFEDHAFAYAPGLTLPIAEGRFSAFGVPLDIPAEPDHDHRMDIDGVFFDADGDGTSEQGRGGFNFYSDTTFCAMQWQATVKGPDADADGWSDAGELALGSSPTEASSTPENSVIPQTILANTPVCEDFEDNDGDGLTDTSDSGCPALPDAAPRLRVIGPRRVSPGDSITYIIEYANLGQKDAENVVVVNKLPNEVEYVSSTGGGSYNVASHEVNWRVGHIPGGQRGDLVVQASVVWGLPQGTLLENLAFIPKDYTAVPVDPTVVVDYEILEATADKLSVRGNVSNDHDSGVLDLDITFQEIPALIEPTFDYFEAGDAIEIEGQFAFEGNSFDLLGFLEKYAGKVKDFVDVAKDFSDFNKAQKDRQAVLDWLLNEDMISQQKYDGLSSANKGISQLQGVVSGVGKLVGTLPKNIGSLWEDGLKAFIEESLPGYETLVGAAIYEHTEGPLPEGWFGNSEEAKKMYDTYKEAYKKFLEETSHSTDEQDSDVTPAHDPNAKHVDRDVAQPGETLNFTVEFENEGEGTAYGVYVTDVLEPDIDASTLDLPAEQGGSYDPDSRTISWLVGQVGPGGVGEFTFSANVSTATACGDEITNFATVYFPSVPETTPTNGVSVRVIDPSCDGDGDGLFDTQDSCPVVFNPADADGDGQDGEDPLDGSDNDGDGWVDEDYESGQENADNDGQGDACDNDDDNDNMLDAFETFYSCLNPLVNDANADPDGDGATNYAEFLADSDPCPADGTFPFKLYLPVIQKQG